MKLRFIEILEMDSNKKGDLFGRLMSDLFHTLGYNEPRLNIHKSGREIDLNASHRLEPKVAIAECKAHKELIGGGDINKFIGVLDAEKRKLKKDKENKKLTVIGYFISLSGFRETAIEQENELDRERVILLKPEKIIAELIRGKILVSIEKAISLLNIDSLNLTLIEHVDLIAYSKGWVWAIYYSDSNGQKVSHFALIHAEGKLLIEELAKEIILLDHNLSNIFSGLTLISHHESLPNQEESLKDAEVKYFQYLENELGEIHFEGLPTDKEAGSVKVKLENIFVPLHLIQVENKQNKNELDFTDNSRKGIGEILEKNSRLAILAKPGGGKSTLIKRIAIAYAFPERRNQINDKLPEKNWFPIFLRCRELGEKVTLSITEIINGIPLRAEIPACAERFSILVSKSLQNGNALLLIDGLDEIADDKNRIAFVNQLRTFIATYPTINIIVTSREAGFRVVGGSLATYCENYTVSNLIESEIEELCLKWHIAIIDNSENTIKEAKKLSELILKDNRIKGLAENPLLLTTLLFVKRWAGYLPTKRTVLYQEMIKLLLVTWNVEGHEILDIEEAEPQLAFIAYWMTKNKQQTISAEELNSCLIEARKQMPEILGYTKVSPSEFIKRVESRSSLLIMTGHKRLDSGNISAVYEFLHLSFQEYLTAKAIVKRFIPISDSKNNIVDIIKPNLNNENWKEVIPLTAVLLERDTKQLIEYLISESKIVSLKDPEERKKRIKLAPSLLGSCLANEIQIIPELLNNAIEWYAKNSDAIRDRKATNEIILKSKFGEIFCDKVKDLFSNPYSDEFARQVGSLVSEIFANDFNNNANPESLFDVLKSDSIKEQCYLILGLMGIAWEIDMQNATRYASFESNIKKLNIEVLKYFKKGDIRIDFSISWYLGFAFNANLLQKDIYLEFLVQLIKNWIKYSEFNVKNNSAWAITRIITPQILKTKISKIPKIKSAIKENYDNPKNEFDKLVAICLGTILGEKWDLAEIKEVFKRHLKLRRPKPTVDNLDEFVKYLGINFEESEQSINLN